MEYFVEYYNLHIFFSLSFGILYNAKYANIRILCQSVTPLGYDNNTWYLNIKLGNVLIFTLNVIIINPVLQAHVIWN